jgi:hypothetical protein
MCHFSTLAEIVHFLIVFHKPESNKTILLLSVIHNSGCFEPIHVFFETLVKKASVNQKFI